MISSDQDNAGNNLSWLNAAQGVYSHNTDSKAYQLVGVMPCSYDFTSSFAATQLTCLLHSPFSGTIENHALHLQMETAQSNIPMKHLSLTAPTTRSTCRHAHSKDWRIGGNSHRGNKQQALCWVICYTVIINLSKRIKWNNEQHQG